MKWSKLYQPQLIGDKRELLPQLETNNLVDLVGLSLPSPSLKVTPQLLMEPYITYLKNNQLLVWLTQNNVEDKEDAKELLLNQLWISSTKTELPPTNYMLMLLDQEQLKLVNTMLLPCHQKFQSMDTLNSHKTLTMI